MAQPYGGPRQKKKEKWEKEKRKKRKKEKKKKERKSKGARMKGYKQCQTDVSGFSHLIKNAGEWGYFLTPSTTLIYIGNGVIQ